MKSTFYSNGKLLLTSEYFVLDGATALAVPTKYGQTLEIDTSEKGKIDWKSFDEKNTVWFEAGFDMNLNLISASNEKKAKTLQNILKEAKRLNPSFLKTPKGFDVETKMDFPRDWGLGTSSTLINNIAQWAGVDAFELLEKSFGGSGYDIACAQNDSPLLYSNKQQPPLVKEVSLDWPFKESLFFVYLNQKQDSKRAIEHYRKINQTKGIDELNKLTERILNCDSLSQFEKLLDAHENLISEALQLPKTKGRLFPDFSGSIKSLGAWGGDFILVTGKDSESYFKQKGYKTIIPFNKMLL